MKFNLKSFISGALIASVLSVAVPVIAKVSTEPINAIYRNIKLVVDGVTVEPKDVNGNIVEPFIYNGTTYLPVRAVATAFGKEVSWDGTNNIVYLGSEVSKPAKELTLWNRSYLETSSSSLVETYSKDGIGYITFKSSWGRSETIADGRKSQTEWVKYPLNSLAKTVSGEFYIAGLDSGEAILRILDSNGNELYESPIMREAVDPIKFNVNIENEIALTFKVEYIAGASNGSSMYIKNPIIVSSDY